RIDVDIAERRWQPDAEVAKDVRARLLAGQSCFQPELDAARPDEGWRQVAEVHRGHHETDAPRARALESVQHREQGAIQPRVVAALEDDVAVVDEDDAGRVLFGGLEDAVHTWEEVWCPADDRPIEQEELALETTGERPADGGLARSWRAGEKDAALRLQPELLGHFGILERHDDVGLEGLEQIVHPF